jgi:gamma-glutamyl hercynylcysteine S-oxide hydrolase
MCRHLAYVGPPVTLADCVLHQPHSLLHQSWAPTDMRGRGTINADGFGIGWLVGDPDDGCVDHGGSDDGGASHGGAGHGRVARRYRRSVPMWSDASLPDLAASVSSGAILAAVRSATAGMPVTETACAPFVEGAWMFSHNGVILGWPGSVAPLAAALPPTDLMTLDAPTDSAFLWALVRAHLREGLSCAAALTAVVGDVLALAPGSRLNLLLHDGIHITATTVGHALWVHDGEGSATVASEVCDPGEERWHPVPDLSLLEATAAHYSIRQHDQGWS